MHSDHAWSWYEPSQRHDTKGPKKGIPYDGKLTKEDGKGKWWEGYDPQELYAQNHPLSENSWDKIVIKSLSESSRLLNGKINEVELLGYGKVDFIRTEKGLEVNLPEAGLNEMAPVLKIRL